MSGECYDRAGALLRPEGEDYVWEDLQALRRKLLKSGSTEILSFRFFHTFRAFPHSAAAEPPRALA